MQLKRGGRKVSLLLFLGYGVITPCSEAQPLPPQIYNQRYTRPGHPNPPRPNFAPTISRMFGSLRSNGQGRISPPPWVKMTRGTRTRAANSTPPSTQDSHYSHFWETWWLYKQKHKILRFVYNDERVLMPKARPPARAKGG